MQKKKTNLRFAHANNSQIQLFSSRFVLALLLALPFLATKFKFTFVQLIVGFFTCTYLHTVIQLCNFFFYFCKRDLYGVDFVFVQKFILISFQFFSLSHLQLVTITNMVMRIICRQVTRGTAWNYL